MPHSFTGMKVSETDSDVLGTASLPVSAVNEQTGSKRQTKESRTNGVGGRQSRQDPSALDPIDCFAKVVPPISV